MFVFSVIVATRAASVGKRLLRTCLRMSMIAGPQATPPALKARRAVALMASSPAAAVAAG